MDDTLQTKDGAEITVIRANPEPEKPSRLVAFLKSLFAR